MVIVSTCSSLQAVFINEHRSVIESVEGRLVTYTVMEHFSPGPVRQSEHTACGLREMQVVLAFPFANNSLIKIQALSYRKLKEPEEVVSLGGMP